MIQQAASPKRNSLAAWTQIEGELMVITPENSVLHRFNEPAAFIWHYLDGEHSLGDIAEMLVREFDITLPNATTDVTDFVARMAQDGLLEHENNGATCLRQE